MNQENVSLGLNISGVLKKFAVGPDGKEWTDEEIEAGLADEYLTEVITFEDGLIIDVWKKEQ